PYYADHYAAFLGPFLALSVGLPVARLAHGLASRPPARIPPSSPAAAMGPQATEPIPLPAPPFPLHRQAAPWLARSGLVLLGRAVLAGAAAQVGDPPDHWIARVTTPAVNLRVIPQGACVLTDSTGYLLIANRFTADRPGCSQMVDSLGTDLALGGGRRRGSGAGRVPAVTGAWRQAFGAAGWALLTPKNRIRTPWNPLLAGYFHRHFDVVRRQDAYNLYRREAIGPA